ncbi:Aldehyde/histidinol dehydrogenase [Pelagophyceae sp. CCMP2097]|nr:Aldehyde/histidinol dehydrogenase [Pelagophyceae sp. CCMP2097]
MASKLSGDSDMTRRFARKQFINGEFVESTSAKEIRVENPSDGWTVGFVTEGSAADASAAVGSAAAAFVEWSRVPAAARGDVLKGMAGVLRANVEPLAKLLAAEQSKALPLARIEIAYAAEYFDYYAGLARSIEGEILPSDSPGEIIYVHKLPVGVCVGIAPWNFPVFVLARKLAPSLVAGCTVVAKSSELTPMTTFELVRLWAEAIDAAKAGSPGADLRLRALPNGAFNVVTGLGSTIGAALCSDDRVALISMTGSVQTGKTIMRAAAANMTKVSLELGGKAPAIVCRDADLDLAVAKIVAGRLCFSGQVCNAPERVYVDEAVSEAFTRKLVSAMAAAIVGDPETPGADYCSLISGEHLEKVQGMVDRAVENGAIRGNFVAGGARVLCGGKRAVGPGQRFLPTVLVGCAQGDEIVQDEVFGPVLPVLTFATLDEAFALANDSKFGLTSSIFTKDLDTVEKARTDLRFGETYVNRHNFEAIQGFHAGCRSSGIGGADGKHGLNEYLQTHAVYVQHASD